KKKLHFKKFTLSNAFHSQYIPYSQTGKFSKIILDYIDNPQKLEDYFEHPVNIEGIKASLIKRKKFNTNRALLTEQLQIQYKDIEEGEQVKANIQMLCLENTFTVCTAHQPNIFTGHLYFIYKILHAIKLTDELKKQLPGYNFVPVFFMGSEDADLEELNFVIVDGKKYEWQPNQTGAVGRMKVDDGLLKLINEIEGRLSVERYGNDVIALLKKCFQKNTTIEQATFLLVHHLFKDFGLVVFLPDNATLKKVMLPVFEEDIFKNIPSTIVGRSSEKLAKNYKIQAHPREINLFYLKEGLRNRIVPFKDQFIVADTDIVFSKDELKKELKNHPGHFSPNVILRGLYQEMILPNIAFIGGGGEIAYWLELKDLFLNYQVPFPLLLVRNSFVLVAKRYHKLLEKTNLNIPDLFRGSQVLLNEIVTTQTSHRLSLDDEKLQVQQAYGSIKKAVSDIDTTLEQHVESLQTKILKKLVALEKKMLRAEKRNFEDQKNQLAKLFAALFPGGNLQERTENFMLHYAKESSSFFDILYENSMTLEQKFCILDGFQ
ncbi:MAG: bacillithiol biosynthesis cysteine-adding enzyme BshC, partial [Ginsengibacter sp.]